MTGTLSSDVVRTAFWSSGQASCVRSRGYVIALLGKMPARESHHPDHVRKLMLSQGQDDTPAS